MSNSQCEQVHELYKRKYPFLYDIFMAGLGELAWQEYIDVLIELERNNNG